MKKIRKLAAERGTTMTKVIEGALRDSFAARAAAKPESVSFPTFKGNGVLPGVDLDSNASIADAMDGL